MRLPNDFDERDYEEKQRIKVRHIAMKAIKICIWILVISFILTAIYHSYYVVNAGNRAVLLTFGKPNMISQSEGIHFKIPFVQSAVIMDVKTQLYSVDKASAASKDLQTATTSVAINYYVNPDSVPSIYKNIGIDYRDKVIAPAVLEVLKASTAQYTAAELVTLRPVVKEKIDEGLRERLNSFNINMQAVSITDFKFSEQFEGAIEGKVTAEQNAMAAKNKLEQVKYEAEQRITQATAEAESIKIQAQAIQVQGGKDYVQLKTIEKWDGKLPQIMMGQATPFIDLTNFNRSS